LTNTIISRTNISFIFTPLESAPHWATELIFVDASIPLAGVQMWQSNASENTNKAVVRMSTLLQPFRRPKGLGRNAESRRELPQSRAGLQPVGSG